MLKRVFEWDENKAKSNLKKHGISFEEAVLAFNDPFLYSEQDRMENGEQRWQTLGCIEGCLLLLIAHTSYFEEIETIRIISCRRANRKEREYYEYGEI